LDDDDAREWYDAMTISSVFHGNDDAEVTFFIVLLVPVPPLYALGSRMCPAGT
jgi:hypothetical protein